MASQSAELTELRKEIEELRQRLSAPGHEDSQPTVTFAAACHARDEIVLPMTREVFRATPTIQDVEDPEIPGVRRFVVRVSTADGEAETLAKYDEWHRRLVGLPANLRTLFALEVDAAGCGRIGSVAPHESDVAWARRRG